MLTLNDTLDRRIIGSKKVVLFESHNFALIPWAECAGQLGSQVRLLTLDYHTDTKEAFGDHVAPRRRTEGMAFDRDAAIRQRIAEVKLSDEASLRAAVLELDHDEHIDAAIRLGVLDVAFVVCHSHWAAHIKSREQQALDVKGKTVVIEGKKHRVPGSPGVAPPPYSYDLPDNRMVVLPRRHGYTWNETAQDGERGYRDAALESEFLCERLGFIDSICESTGIPKLFEAPFILDIDLDYLNTRRAVAPSDGSMFKQLVQRAQLITVARETVCVESHRLENERLTSEWLEGELMKLIADALEPADKGKHGTPAEP